MVVDLLTSLDDEERGMMRESILRYTCIAIIPEAAMLAIRLSEDIESRLEALAKRTGRTKTFYAREAIERHLEDLEDLYLAERVSKRIRAGKEQTSSLEEVEARLGLAD
jgi:RHH-type rel operon transcriptional repressor/antitoxin RelB